MTIRVACIGGGPGGLFFSALIKQALPTAGVVLFERNQASDAFGFGVVFSDATLRRIDEADPVLRDGLRDFGTHWDAIEVWLKGDKTRFGGNGMAAIHRKTLLGLLQKRAADVGVDMRFGEQVSTADLGDFDLVVGADGANSATRELLDSDSLGHEVETATAKFIWFGTTYKFAGLTFVHRQNEHGNFAAHAYPISDDLSTFIVEADEATWRRAGLDDFDTTQSPGVSDLKTQAYLEELFSADIDGHPLVANNSRWANFRTRATTRTWHKGNVVLLGDAVHTAHFSVGSGTKMAMEDAVSLAREVAATPEDFAGAFLRYESERMPQVARIQDSARPSLSWWEHFGRYYTAFDPLQFTFHFFSRSISIEKIRQRDPDLVAATEAAWHSVHHAAPLASPFTAPNGTTFTTRNLSLIETDGSISGITDGVVTLPISADGGTDGHAMLLTAPDSEDSLPEVVNHLPSAPTTVVIIGGTPLTRQLLSEEARLAGGHRTVLVVSAETDDATTLILSGRADAVVSLGETDA